MPAGGTRLVPSCCSAGRAAASGGEGTKRRRCGMPVGSAGKPRAGCEGSERGPAACPGSRLPEEPLLLWQGWCVPQITQPLGTEVLLAKSIPRPSKRSFSCSQHRGAEHSTLGSMASPQSSHGEGDPEVDAKRWQSSAPGEGGSCCPSCPEPPQRGGCELLGLNPSSWSREGLWLAPELGPGSSWSKACSVGS